MRAGGKFRVVLVTCGSVPEARRIARSVVARRLAACVNVLPSPIESYYTWKGKLESAREYLLIIKTAAKCVARLEREVHRLHTYDVPEFVALPVAAGSKKYLSWLDQVTRTPK